MPKFQVQVSYEIRGYSWRTVEAQTGEEAMQVFADRYDVDVNEKFDGMDTGVDELFNLDLAEEFTCEIVGFKEVKEEPCKTKSTGD